MARSVLVVEDNADIAALLGQLLAAYDCDVKVAEDLDQVKARLGNSGVDLVLLDIMLPESESDGREIARFMRERFPDMPIYFMTGVMKPEIGDEYLKIADGVLKKPFSIADLRAVLERTFGEDLEPNVGSEVHDLLGMITTIATEQEEIRRQQARIASFVTVFQEGGESEPTAEELSRFRGDVARYEEGLSRVERSLAEIQEMLRSKGALLGKGQ